MVLMQQKNFFKNPLSPLSTKGNFRVSNPDSLAEVSSSSLTDATHTLAPQAENSFAVSFPTLP